jgi:division/cell wall cluster transcriptional repressor MraZ
MSEESPQLYSGTFERSMDAKKRVAVPSGWLVKKEGEEFYTIPHPKTPCILVMPPVEFERWEQKFESAPNLTAMQRRRSVMRFYASAHRVATDGQGRILLNEEQCAKVGLKGSVLFAGGKSRFEIWDKVRFEESMAEEEGDYLKAAEEIGL